MESYELFIVGAGAAGISAAVAAWDAGARRILLADRETAPGGVLPRCIHHGFGLATFGEELTGPEYAARILASLEKTGVELRPGTTVLKVNRDRTALLSGREGLETVSFQRMILATGCRERTLGSLGLSGTRPAGVFTAGEAQELINLHRADIGNEAVILGSGDLGMILARRMVLEGKRVLAVVEKNGHYGGMARNYHRCLEKYRIPLLLSTELTRIHGEGRITAVTLKNADGEQTVSCDTLITAIGLLPERTLVSGLGAPEWLTLCGNCNRVHDIVDSAVEEAVQAGRKVCSE